MKQQSMFDLNISSRSWQNFCSVILSLNCNVQGLTCAQRIRLLLSISIEWSIISSTCSAAESTDDVDKALFIPGVTSFASGSSLVGVEETTPGFFAVTLNTPSSAQVS